MKKSKFTIWLKRIVYWGLVIAFFWFINKYFADIEDFVEVVRDADYRWFAVAFAISMLSFCLLAILYRSSVSKLGYNETSIARAIQNFFAFMFVSIINPTSGWGGTLYHANLYSSRNPRSLGGALVGTLVVWILYGFWGISLILPALYYVAPYNGYIKSLGFIAVTLYSVELFVICLTLLSGDRRPVTLNRFAVWISNKWSKVGGLFALSSNSFEVNVHDYCISSKTVAHGSGRYWGELVGTFLVHLTQLIAMICLFIAFGAPVTAAGVIVCYSLLLLFSTISPTPQGIGVAEGLVQVAMSAIGYDSGKSLAVILAYRGITLWIPLLIGFIAFKKISMFDNKAVNSFKDSTPDEVLV
ncbi:MAG: lysylphosphatidylglycerol synthase transmembrane domain-containing protein [Candidatus Dojkabacteria bacterium]|nr:MAG: lysylphosphatidylglycerol synthase transmembrane domain-containing protein [Candidatus Dojkabacteria bacterium]